MRIDGGPMTKAAVFIKHRALPGKRDQVHRIWEKHLNIYPECRFFSHQRRNRMTKKLSALALGLSLVFATAAGAEPFRLTVEGEAVVATGATAKGQVVFFGITREVAPDDVVEVNRKVDVLTDEDGDGRVAFPQGRAVPLRSAWVAVDLTSGDVEAAAPEGFRLKKVNFRGRGAGKRPDGRGSVVDARGIAELLVVRPGVGAWTLYLGDGGPGDEDGTPNGQLEAALDRMEPLAGSPPPPQTFQKDDVVVLLDPDQLEMTLIKLPAAE